VITRASISSFYSLFSQSLPEFVGVVSIKEDDTKTILLEVEVKRKFLPFVLFG
jgi:hypothetical protein